MALLFSGRRNPEWELTPGQQLQWQELWKQAPATNERATLVSKLGYTGCRLQPDEHSYWLISGGCVSFYQKDAVLSKLDGGRKMELFLLNTSPEDTRQILRTQEIL